MDEIKTPLFMGTLFIWHVLYFAVFFGLAYIDETYIRWLSTGIQIFICLFLIVRFRPFREYTITRFDASVIFASATIMLTNVLTTEIFSAYMGTFTDGVKGIVSIKNKETEPETKTETTPPTSTLTYAPNPTLHGTSNTNTIGPIVTKPITNSTPDQQQSTKITYYNPS